MFFTQKNYYTSDTLYSIEVGMFTTNWWIGQGFALIGLIFIVIGLQQKNRRNLLWLQTISAAFITVGFFFLGEASIIVLGIIVVLQSIFSLILSYVTLRSKVDLILRLCVGAFFVAILVGTNIYLSQSFSVVGALSIVVGISMIAMLLQRKAAQIRKMMVFTQTLCIILYLLVFSPVNIIISGLRLASAVIGIVRLDLFSRLNFRLDSL